MQVEHTAPPDDDPVIYDLTDGVARLTLNRPERLNTLSVEMVECLVDRLAKADADPSVRVIVLSAIGRAFCAGADLNATSGKLPQEDLPQLLAGIQDARVPVVARVAGHCAGGGVGLVAACDISVAALDVQFGFPEVRIGRAPSMISVVCLSRMRRGDALELFLSGEKVSAERAVEVGLVTRAVPAEVLDETIDGFVDKLLRGGPAALAGAKDLVNRVPSMTREEAFAWTQAESLRRMTTDEAREGSAAFLEKRQPTWVPEQAATTGRLP